MVVCKKCTNIIVNDHYILCSFCNCTYHNRCVYGPMSDPHWLCSDCTGSLFPFNHILDDDEFRYSLDYFYNSVEYNKLLSLKLNPFLFDDVINNDSANNLLNPNSDNSCNYIYDSSLEGVDVSFKNGFSILHLNARSFDRNQDDIDIFLSSFKFNFSAIAVSETWFKDDDSNLVDVPNYSLVSVPRQNRRSGGSALCVHNSISFEVRNDLKLCSHTPNLVDHSESVFIEIKNSNSKNIIVGNVYRAHLTDINLFNSDLVRCLDTISFENKLCYICGDFNLDLLKHDSESKINDFLTTFFEHNMFPLIDRPTRITSYSATLLDNIFTNVFDNKIKSGVFISDITDHFPIFQMTNLLSIKKAPPRASKGRSFTRHNMNAFIHQVESTDWDFVDNEMCANNAYTLFLNKFTCIYDKCFPVRSFKSKSRTNHVPRKPWITSAILKSIRRKHKLYLKYTSFPTDSNKLVYVNYRNKLTNLIRVSKKSYYSNLLDEHKNNLKQTWNMLNGLLGRNRNKSFPNCFNINGTLTSDFKKYCRRI